MTTAKRAFGKQSPLRRGLLRCAIALLAMTYVILHKTAVYGVAEGGGGVSVGIGVEVGEGVDVSRGVRVAEGV